MTTEEPMPVLPISYAPVDEGRPVLRAIGWLSLALFGGAALQTAMQLVFEVVRSSILQSGSFSLIYELIFCVRLPLLIWLCIAAWRLGSGRGPAKTLALACWIFAAYAVIAAVVWALIVMAMGNGPRWSGQMVLGVSHFLVETAFPVAVALLLRPYRQADPN